MPSFDHHPELILVIIKYTPSKGDVAHLAQTCHGLYGLVMPELYRQSYRDNEAQTLYWAAKNGHNQVVQFFLEANGHLGLEMLLPHMNDALSLSAQRGQISVVKTLLSMEGVDPDNIDPYRRTPLSYAAQGAHLNIVRSLLETNRVNPNSKDRAFGQSALIWAVRGPQDKLGLELEPAATGMPSLEDSAISVIQLLLENGANIDSLDYDYRSALYWATARGFGSIAMVRLFLHNGASPDGHVSDRLAGAWRASIFSQGNPPPFVTRGMEWA
ncbi:ankyrin repeat-containing domain protein [Penicillium canescens]|uniref:Ankyrin repeat-containing domain protein n=1 Tax=Penicillium canescens TaxID=5083 RepID=A0AAD6N7Z7_PENCN|nr:ankyrin repeat-containing domain protein [Penicillium canescens]KAJ6020112.1 ankyrin repeat-containing domain protein [Penicillium canescens]KAJ6038057.1 ankyrin repeat-containing domain protein [Penicillium canescens]KAJ6045467.1 ankyrin repeat-containing domain protein [Penicillium canescens]KAJ6061148.1 ankyrin repeat-containing domain protein [Penicillium canescens]KAJ6090693.1 ankyrin repeat-containing domain protein [Penicillium canescens]